MENKDWRNALVNIVTIICLTIVASLAVSGCNGCVQQNHDYRMKQLERQSR